MLNGSVFGQRFYAARNPPWTAHKPTMSLRANGQIAGKYGHGDQRYVRRIFAETGIQNFGMHGFAMINGKMTPKPAVADKAVFASLLKYILHHLILLKALKSPARKEFLCASSLPSCDC